jgi:hypothetical protein
MSEDRESAEGDSPSDSYDAANPAQVRARKRSARLRDEQRREFFAKFVADPLARSFSWELLSSLHVWEKRVGLQRQDNEFWEGEREAGLRILRALLRSQPALAAQMIAENDHG